MRTNRWLLLGLLLLCSVAEAAKVRVSWENATVNTDGSAYNNPSHVIVEWGTCNGNIFGTRQSAVQAPFPLTSTFIYPSGMSRVCIRAFSVNTASVSSGPSNLLIKNLLPTTGKPVTLDQPVVLPE